MRKISGHIILTCVAALMLPLVASTACPAEFPLFSDESTLAVRITGPLSTIMRNRDEEEEYPATLSYSDAEGTNHSLDIQLRVRGKYRRKRSVCSFAPLRVNFQKKQIKGTIFDGQNKTKLVTDCQSSNRNYQQYLLREYLIYKLLNLMTDRSFRARLLRVTYIDTDRKNRERESYAFFIEEKRQISERLGMKRATVTTTKYGALDPVHSNLINVFEYFIGNTDFSLIAGPKGIPCCHNATLYQKDTAPFIPIPYDFDHAGIVDAPHAGPNPKFRLKSVRQRLYRGRCANNAHLEAHFQLFRDKRDQVRQLVESIEGFNTRTIKTTHSFLDAFYRDISSEKSIKRKFLKRCS